MTDPMLSNIPATSDNDGLASLTPNGVTPRLQLTELFDVTRMVQWVDVFDNASTEPLEFDAIHCVPNEEARREAFSEERVKKARAVPLAQFSHSLSHCPTLGQTPAESYLETKKLLRHQPSHSVPSEMLGPYDEIVSVPQFFYDDMSSASAGAMRSTVRPPSPPIKRDDAYLRDLLDRTKQKIESHGDRRAKASKEMDSFYRNFTPVLTPNTITTIPEGHEAPLKSRFFQPVRPSRGKSKSTRRKSQSSSRKSTAVEASRKSSRKRKKNSRDEVYERTDLIDIKELEDVQGPLDTPDKIKQQWRVIALKHSPKAYRKQRTSNVRKRNQRKAVAAALKKKLAEKMPSGDILAKDAALRGKNISKNTMAHIRKSSLEVVQRRRKARKDANQKRKKKQEERETMRQEKKLSYLLTQTELFSHFMAEKIRNKNDSEENASRPKLTENELDKMSEEDIKKAAESAASEAISRHRDRINKFDTSVQNKQNRTKEPPLKRRKTGGVATQETDDVVTKPKENKLKLDDIFKATLKQYQKNGLTWLINLYDQGINGILADDMGLGKTVQTLAFMAYLAAELDVWGPFLVVAPSSTLHNWACEVQKFVPSLKVLPYWGTTAQRQKLRKSWHADYLYQKDSSFHVLITSYSLVIKDMKYLKRLQWSYIILDEAHSIKNSNSLRWSTLLRFKCRNRLLLTGTPIQNNMAEFIMPDLFDSHENFYEWFSKDIEQHSAKSQASLNEHQLQRLHGILKPFMLRRIKRDVASELPKKTEIQVDCYLTPRQRAMYQKMKNNMTIGQLLNKSAIDKSSMKSLMNLVMQFRKVCNHPEIYERTKTSYPYHFIVPQTSHPSCARTLVPAYKNPIEFIIPRLVLDENLVQVAAPYTKPSKVQRICNQLYIFNAAYVERSLRPTSPTDNRPVSDCFSFLRFSDLSPAQLVSFWKSPFFPDRWQTRAEACSRNKKLRFFSKEGSGFDYGDVTVNTSARFLISEVLSTTSIANICTSVALSHLVKTEWSQRLEERQSDILNLAIIKPATFAPSVRFHCKHRGFLDEQFHITHDPKIKRLFMGPDYVCRAGLPQPEPFLTEVRTTRRTPPPRILLPALNHFGETNIFVPQFSSLVQHSGKLRVLDDLLRKLKKENHRVLVYSQMTSMLDILEDFLWVRQHQFVRLDGSKRIDDRRDVVRKFMNDPDIFVFLLSTRAGGIGINLTAADTVIFYDSDWNPTIDAQAMDRAHRLGQTRDVTVYRLITRNTVEEKILKRAKQKHKMQNLVMEGGNFEMEDVFQPAEMVDLLLEDAEEGSAEQLALASKKRKATSVLPRGTVRGTKKKKVSETKSSSTSPTKP